MFWFSLTEEDDVGIIVDTCSTAAAFPRSPSLPSPTMRNRNPYDLRATYTCFRILIIGRANTGKTTILQRVCNTTEDPYIYDENKKILVSVHGPEDEFCF